MRQDATSRSVEPETALARGLGLLNLILRDGGHTKALDLARPLGLSRATLHRLLGELHRAGLILRVGRGRYDAGLGLAVSISGVSFNTQLARAARPALQRLVKRQGVTAHLGVLENEMVTYLVKASPRLSAVSFTQENGQLEAYCSGIGKVLLGHLPDAEQHRYLQAGPFVALTPNTITEPDLLKACFDAARRDGHASDREEISEGLHCLAVPVRMGANGVVAAISASTVAVGGMSPSVLEALHACSRAIEIDLGGQSVGEWSLPAPTNVEHSAL